MKYMFVSDIHGNIEILTFIIEAFKKENANMLVILGDTSASNLNDNEKINRNEICLIRAIVPPFNTTIPNKIQKETEVKAFS